MLENQSNTEVSVDRREESVRTEQPGYQSTQQVIQDVAGDRRLQLFQINRSLFMVLGVLELMLGLRFILKLLAANPGNGFASFIYGLTGAFTKPFDALLGTPAIDGQIFETTTLIAMSIYAMFFGLVAQLILLIGDRPRVRSLARSVQEQTPGPAPVINVDRINRTDSPRSLNALVVPIAVSAAQRAPLFHAYNKFMRQHQRLLTLKTRYDTRLNAHATLLNAAEIINIEQLPGDLSLEQIDRTNPAESINVEQLPGDVSLDQIKRAARPRSIRSVKLPVKADAAQKGPWLQAYSELVQRHRPALSGLPKSDISPN